jgi:NAD(P)-dependent dehydrogenase (short-subunit alcohol dehydrogenase family)
MADPQHIPVAAVVGVSPGLGAALARRFAQEYAVAIMARNAEYLHALAGELRAVGGRVLAVPADSGDRAQVEAAFASIREQLGPPAVLLYNAGGGTWGTVTEITPEQYKDAWRVNSYGAFVSAKAVVPDLIDRGRGVLLFTSATAGVKAGPKSVAFGPAKFALRGLAQSLARDLGPKGIHVAWINVDGVIDIPSTRERFPLEYE